MLGHGRRGWQPGAQTVAAGLPARSHRRFAESSIPEHGHFALVSIGHGHRLSHSGRFHTLPGAGFARNNQV